MRRLLTALIVLGACGVAVVLSGATGGGGGKRTYKIVFDNAFGLTEGGDFRVGGVKAGKTTAFSVEKQRGKGAKAVVTAEVTQPGFGDFRSNASCEIKPQSLIGEYFVDCQPGNSKKRLQNGGTVPVENTNSTVPADLVNDIMRRPYRERFRIILTELGATVAGRPRDIQEVLRRAHPGLRETSRVLRILGNQNQIIQNFITDSDTVVAELEHNKRDVARWVTETGRTAEISATRRQALQETFHKLPNFLSELRPTMRRLGQLADEQTPLLADAQRAAPDLDTFLRRLGPFSEASRPAVRSLGEASKSGSKAIGHSKEEVAQLQAVGKEAKPFAKPLRQFLQASDSRARATENDPRAKVAAPPAPDPTAIPGQGGFTALESIWNYFFWQTLSINMLDDFGHIVRLGLTVNECSDFQTQKTSANAALFAKCNSYLGPNQPGIQGDVGDPLANTIRARELRKNSGKPAKRVGERRGEGQPEAGPVPGQRDLSKPQIVLPPNLQQLLDQLPKLGKGGTKKNPLPQLPNLLGNPNRRQGSTDNQLLDYLLGQ
jgi:phospholipid/cholesterol/gamma-HCH transport system substrate-binding protein